MKDDEIIKDIKISYEDWEKLMKIKLKLRLKSVAEVITLYHKLIVYLKLNNELEDLYNKNGRH